MKVLVKNHIDKHIYIIRGVKVMLDSDLANLYGVRTKELNKAVGRNKVRFPLDFMFQLTHDEVNNLRFQIGTSSWGGRRYQPRVFTEQGVAMLSSVLRSKRAALVNIEIMRAFVRLRELLMSNKELAAKVENLERKFGAHDDHIKEIFTALRQLINQPQKSKKHIGFQHE